MFKHILIPTDGSKTASKAVKGGIALAAEIGAKVTGLHVQEPVPMHLYGEGYVADKRIVAEFAKRAKEHAERCLEPMQKAADAAGVEFESMIVQAAVPYRGIVDAAAKKKCDAIFISSHGYRGLNKLLLGSVTQEVLTHSKVPVLVFR